MIIVTDELVAEFEQIFDGAISDRSDAEILELAAQVRDKLDFDIFQFITPAPFSYWYDAIVFVVQLDELIARLTRNQPTDSADLADTQADALGTLW